MNAAFQSFEIGMSEGGLLMEQLMALLMALSMGMLMGL
jgi:hypothetical protein